MPIAFLLLALGGAAPDAFASRVDAAEETLVLVDAGAFRMRVYARGALAREYEIGLGQAPGPKERRGDLRTPRGTYFVTSKSQGPFAGDYADYFGGHWIALNYPGPDDARRGVKQGLIDDATAGAISAKWRARQPTPKTTALGGGIGFHGWAHEWTMAEDGGYLSWGCVVLHLADVADFYARVPVGAKVVIF
ncbi:MAG TPA: L,D-transpeptidase [Myxococcaceae bacterium]|nr:L,D-transpeptidase [Myxococcaceae bacterium]